MRSLTHSILLTLPFLVAACGGGGGDAGPPAAALSGTLTIANVGASLGDPGTFDDDWRHARDVGTAGTDRPLHVAGRIGPIDADPLDVLRVHLTAGRTALQLERGNAVELALHLIETRSGRLVRRVAAGDVAIVDAPAGTTIDLVVECVRGEGPYALTVAANAPSPTADAVLPLGADAPDLRSAAQARYLGAHHEMVPGEVVVLTELTSPLDGPAFQATGLAPVFPAHGDEDLGLYRLAAAQAAPLDTGVPIERSLEMETCLAARQLESLKGVRAASPNLIRRALTTVPNDPFFRHQWHFQMLRMDVAWDVTTGSGNVVVGVADTGIVSSHPDFSGRLLPGFDFISDPARARDGNGIDPNPEDEGDLSNPPNSSWHGTHVAGTIGARANDGVGVPGMDWNCGLMPLRVLGQNGGSSFDILEAVKFAAGLANASGSTPQVPRGRVDVLNMSLGGGGSSTAEEAVYAQARQAGVLIVCAAGNDGTTEPGFPASYPTNLSVGSVRLDKTRAFYSNQANTVDVMAPGGDVTVDQNGDQFADGVLSASADASKNPVWVFEMGTSMASPHVAGLASLVLAARPGATPATIESLILNNAEDLGAAGVDPVFQHGLIDPVATLRAAANSNPTTPILSATPIAVSLGTTATTAQIALSNVGDPNQQVVIDPNTNPTVTPANTPWITGATFQASAGPSISHDRLDLTVNRTGLANGRHTATLTITPNNAAAVSIAVTLDVGTTTINDTVYVLLVDSTTLDTVGQTDTDALRSFGWSLGSTAQLPIADGTYLLVAGTDRDNDDFIGDEGELFGVWPLEDSPEALAISPGARIFNGLDFALTPVNELTSVRPQRGYHRIR